MCVFVDWSFHSWYVDRSSWDQAKIIFIDFNLLWHCWNAYNFCHFNEVWVGYMWTLSGPKWDVSWSKIEYRWVVRFTKIYCRWVLSKVNVLHLMGNVTKKVRTLVVERYKHRHRERIKLYHKAIPIHIKGSIW